MKKFFALLLALTMSLSLIACGAKEAPVADEAPAEDIPKRTCPVCNTVHDFDYPKCPKCKYDYYSK